MNPIKNPPLPVEKIKEIFNRLPDERINRDTTGRSNLNLLNGPLDSNSVSFDRIPDSTVLTFANKKKKTQATVQEIPISTINEPLNLNPLENINTANPQPISQKTIEEEPSPEMERIATGILVATIDSMSSMFVFSLACLLYYELLFQGWLLFMILLLICSWHVIRNLYYYCFTIDDEGDVRNKLISELFDEILLLFVTIGIFFYTEFKLFPLLYVALPLPLLNLCIWYTLNLKESKSYLYTSSTIRLYLFVQLLHISLKTDHFIFWEWKMVFWPSWLIFVLISLYVLGVIVLILYSSVQICFGRKNNYQIHGLLWCLNILLLLDVNVFLLSSGFSDYFSFGDSWGLRLNFLIMSIWFPTSQVLTFLFSKPLKFFIIKINEDANLSLDSSEIDNMESQPPQIPNSLEIKTKSKKSEMVLERKTNLPKNVPQFLVKFSASYFQVADFKKEVVFGILKHKLRVPKSAQKQKLKKNKQKNEQNKQPEIGGFQNFELVELQNKPTIFKKTNDNKIDMKQKNVDNTDTYSASLSQIIKTESEKSIKTCVICCDRIPNAVIMDCGHGGICYECALNIWKKTDGECHLCRKPISKILQIETNAKSKVLMPVLAVVERKNKL